MPIQVTDLFIKEGPCQLIAKLPFRFFKSNFIGER